MFHEEDGLGSIWYREWQEVIRMQFPRRERSRSYLSKSVWKGTGSMHLLVHTLDTSLRNGSSLFPCPEETGGTFCFCKRPDPAFTVTPWERVRDPRYGVCRLQQSIDQRNLHLKPVLFQFHSRTRIFEICLPRYGKLLTMVFGLWKWETVSRIRVDRSAAWMEVAREERIWNFYYQHFRKFLEPGLKPGPSLRNLADVWDHGNAIVCGRGLVSLVDGIKVIWQTTILTSILESFEIEELLLIAVCIIKTWWESFFCKSILWFCVL